MPNICLICTILMTSHIYSVISHFSPEKILFYREKVGNMFYHAYNGYLDHAFPFDELKPLTCSGMDTWGSFSLSLIDALDTLIIMANYSEFARASKLVQSSIDFDANVNVSVFETNIRVVGGLLAAHLLSDKATPYVQLEDGWPCSGPLLRLAERVAHRLLPAFNTATGMPYGTVNLRYGVHTQETPITCTAGVGTYIVEFGALSRLTGNKHFERIAMKAMDSLYKHRSVLNLVGNHINVQTGAWTATDAGIGAGVDSYFEYLVKGSALLNRPELMRQFREYLPAINEHVRKGDYFMWVSMTKAQVSLPVFQSLEAFWPGLLTLNGDTDTAQRVMLTYHSIIKQYGFAPEFYNIPNLEAVHKRSGYPLRPEFVESAYYLYKATKDPLYMQMGVDVLESIEHSCKTECGYATVHNVKDHLLEDRMESFFLSETAKYLYLLFDVHNFISNPGDTGKIVQTPGGACVVHSGGYIFNTEAHPIDPAALYCCHNRRKEDMEKIEHFESNLDLLDTLGLGENKRLTLSDWAQQLQDLPNEIIELGSRTEDERDRVMYQSATGNGDIGWEVDNTLEEEIDKDEIVEPLKISAGVADASSPGVAVVAPQIGPTKQDKINKAIEDLLKVAGTKNINQLNNTASDLVTALKNVVKDWNKLLQKVNVVKNKGCDSSQDASCSVGTCRITQNPVLYKFLRVMYRKSMTETDSVCSVNEGPSIKDNYKNIHPDSDPQFDTWMDYDNVMDYRTCMYRDKAMLNYELMSCPVLTFLSRYSTSGFVLPNV